VLNVQLHLASNDNDCVHSRPWLQTVRDGSYWWQPVQLTSPADADRLPTASQAEYTHDDAVPTANIHFTHQLIHGNYYDSICTDRESRQCTTSTAQLQQSNDCCILPTNCKAVKKLMKAVEISN